MEQIFKMYYSYWLLSYCNQHTTTPTKRNQPLRSDLHVLVLRRHWPHLSQQGYPCSHAVIRVLWVAPTAWLWLPAPVSGLCFLPPFSWKGKVPRFWHIHYTFWLHLFLGPRDFERKAIMLRQEMEGGLGVLLGCLCDCLNSAYFLLVFPFDKARSLELYESFIFVPVPKWLTE